MLLDFFGLFVVIELMFSIALAYKRLNEFLSTKFTPLIYLALGFLSLAIGHLLHAIMFFFDPISSEILLRTFELLSGVMISLPYVLRRKREAVASLFMIPVILGGISSLIFLYIAISLYSVYSENKNTDTMLLCTSFMLLFLSEVMVASSLAPIIFSGYFARILCFITLLYLTLRFRK